MKKYLSYLLGEIYMTPSVLPSGTTKIFIRYI